MKSIPVPLTSFIGRSHELRDVIAALEHDRLVTLTGIGGVGKTRLAQAVAQAHSGDVIWVDLAPLDNEALIGPTVVRALGLAEAPRSDAATLVAEAIADTEFLLVVDNCEHLLDPVASLIETWLRSCPFLRILATSRESVRVPGEFVYLVPPLALEAAGDEVPDAIRLFIERARSASGLFELDNGTGEEVASLCRHLDGIPLAIELAAARVRALGVSEVLAGLHDSLGLLTAGPRTALARHRTLDQSIAWSFSLLNDREQAMLRRLAVFAGWFSIPAAQAIGTGHPIEPGAVVDSLTALVDKSLLQPALREGRARYRLLEVVRQFSRARLEAAGETQEVRRRHATWVVAEAERRAPLLFGTQVVDVLDDLERDLDDIRAASAWASRAGDHELALRMLATPWLLWLCRYPAEGRQRIEEALEASDRAPPHVLARAHVVAGWLDLRASRTETSQAHALQALALGEEIRAPAVRAQARTLLGWNAMFLAPATAESVLMEAEAETRAVDDQQHHAWALAGLGFISAHHGRPDDALDYLGRSLMVARKAGDWVGIRRALGLSGVLLAVRGSFDEAGAKFEECEQITRGLCDRYFLAQALEYRGFISLHRGDLEDAQRRIEESLSVARQSSAVALCRSQTMMALFHLALGEFDVAVAQAEQVLETVRVSGLNWHFSMAFAVAAEAYRRASRSDEAERIRQEGVTRAREAGLAWAEALSEAAGDRPVNLMRGIDGLARLSHAPELIRTLEALAIAVGSAERDSDDYAEATLLLSGTAAARRRLRLVAFPVDRAPLAQMAERLQDLLGANWEDVQERGAAMSLDDLARRVLRMRGPRRRPPSGWESLTPTERRVAELAAEGLRNAEIAERLFVAPGTVKVHLSHIFSKLGARTRTELSAIYARVGRR